jgi:hypothetical protein
MNTTKEFVTCDYCGQHHGWHFYVVERADHREAAIDAGMPTSVFYGLAIPPIDGKPYGTTENRQPPDPRAAGGVPAGTLQEIGTCQAEAIYKAVSAMYDAM